MSQDGSSAQANRSLILLAWCITLIDLEVNVETYVADRRLVIELDVNVVRLLPVRLPERVERLIEQLADAMIGLARRQRPHRLAVDLFNLITVISISTIVGLGGHSRKLALPPQQSLLCRCARR